MLVRCHMNVIKLKGTSWLAYDGTKGILIDTGTRGCKRAILKSISFLKLSIPVIFMTHTHIDHAGSLEEIRKVTGAKIAVSSKESVCLRNGRSFAPAGNTFIGDVLSRAIGLLSKIGRKEFAPVTGNIVEIEHGGPVGFGFDAEVFILGAHTEGSIGLKAGEYFFAGDAVFNIGRINIPIFAYKKDEIKTAWATILQSGAKYICPGRGKMFTREKLVKLYKEKFTEK
jgi:glyoxylase-like metal-dependent hydrolase (beta-lactamase superfamily II)